AITHFDGAFRIYPAEAYLDRIDTDISRAGKQASYTKVFRLDGPLPIPYWKRLLSDFFRGNKLIPEYLGAPEDVVEEMVAEPPTDVYSTAPTETGPMALATLISLEPGSIDDPIQVCSEYFEEGAAKPIPYLELGVGEIAR